LYIPERIPTLPPGWQEDWATYSFVDLSVALLSLYISPDELSREELRALVSRSYTATFRHADITPLTKLSDNEFILELFHGPTFSFKDVALQLLGNLFEFFLARRNARKSAGERPESLTVVGATSGDTGRCARIFCSLPRVCMYICIRFDNYAIKQRGYLWLEGEKEFVHIHLAPQGPRFACARSADDDRHRLQRVQYRRKGYF
jgi:threonine synthase